MRSRETPKTISNAARELSEKRRQESNETWEILKLPARLRLCLLLLFSLRSFFCFIFVSTSKTCKWINLILCSCYVCVCVLFFSRAHFWLLPQFSISLFSTFWFCSWLLMYRVSVGLVFFFRLPRTRCWSVRCAALEVASARWFSFVN